MSSVALAELNAGRVDEALAIARQILATQPKIDQARTIASRALTLKGAFDEALAILDHPVSDGKQHYDGSGDELQRFKEAAASEQRRLARHASVFGPTRLLAMARVYLAADDPARALDVLERCAPLVTNNAVTEMLYQPFVARAWAQRRDASKADTHLARMWQLTSAHPNRERDFGAHTVAGACALELGRLDDALSHLTKATNGLRHPIDRHGARYLLARTHAAAGRANEAAESYRAVVADGFATRFHALALAALDRG
jgi:tetratricopeptide (TPR) repeat protein